MTGKRKIKPDISEVTANIWFNQLYPIWLEYYQDQEDRDEDDKIFLPGIPSNIKENSLLFIGINPSSSESYYAKELEKTVYEGKGMYLVKNLRWKRWKDRDISRFNLARTLDIEKTLGENHSYFKHINIIKEVTGMDNSHLDLIFIRDSNQKKIVKKFLNAKKESKELLFAQKQLEISFDLLNNSLPRAIIVANAETFRVLLKHCGDRIYGSLLTNGRYIYRLNEKNVPVLPLSYFRYLSTGVFYTLVHSIKSNIIKPIHNDELIPASNEEIKKFLKQ